MGGLTSLATFPVARWSAAVVHQPRHTPTTRHSVATAWLARSADTKAYRAIVATRSLWREPRRPSSGSGSPLQPLHLALEPLHFGRLGLRAAKASTELAATCSVRHVLNWPMLNWPVLTPSSPAQSRVIILWGSVNRDEKRWGDPDRFDVRRDRAGDHVGFGCGERVCIENNLARMEMAALFSALLPKASWFRLHGEERVINNTLRGFKHLQASVE